MKVAVFHKYVSCLLAVLLFACAPQRDRTEAGVLTVSKAHATAFIRNFNPLLPEGSQLWPSKAGVYESLEIYNTVTQEYVPWLATGHQWSADGSMLTFALRDGVRWSDGEPFSAADVVFTFELIRAHPALDLHQIWTHIDSVQSPDGRRVEIQFKAPYVPALVYLAHQPIVPQHVWSGVSDPVTFANENPVGTGPFTEVNVFRSQVYELGRNPYYWQPGKPEVRALRMPAYSGNEQTTLALMNGELDWAGAFVPAIDRIFVQRDPAHHGYWFPLVAGSVMLYANAARTPFDDVAVRKAFSMAIDRELIVQVAMHGYTRPADATALSDAYTELRDETAVQRGTWVKRDVPAARRMLDAAGYVLGDDGFRRTKEGARFRYDIIVSAGWSDWVRTGQIIAQGLREIGVDARLRTYDFTAWFNKLQTGDFDLSLGWTDEGPTPYKLYRALMSSATLRPPGEVAESNWHRFSHPTADVLLRRFEGTLDPAEGKRILVELQRLFVQEAPAIPLFLAPSWGEFNSTRFVGFPDANRPTSKLTPNNPPECLLVMTALRQRGAPSAGSQPGNQLEPLGEGDPVGAPALSPMSPPLGGVQTAPEAVP